MFSDALRKRKEGFADVWQGNPDSGDCCDRACIHLSH